MSPIMLYFSEKGLTNNDYATTQDKAFHKVKNLVYFQPNNIIIEGNERT